MTVRSRAAVISAIVALMALAAAGGAFAASQLIHESPKVGGGGPYTNVMWGDGANGEAASFVVERDGQRSGMSQDDGAAFVARVDMNTNNPDFAAVRAENSKQSAVVARNGHPLPALRVEKGINLDSAGSKKNVIGADIEGSIKVTGKRGEALLYVNGDDLFLEIGGQTYELSK